MRQEGESTKDFTNIFETLKGMRKMHPSQSGHLNLPNHSCKHVADCAISLHYGDTESRKSFEQKFIFRIVTLNQKRNQRTLFFSIA